MRNFSMDRGLVKNARVMVIAIGSRIVTVKLLQEGHSNEEFLIPRIIFTAVLPSKHTLMRRQFPLAPAYATTFNGCQGLTLDKIGVDLTRPVFSHGQLYTALSRIRNRHDGAVLLKEESGGWTFNVTYDELLAD
ncbi:hypothetical protein CPC08DRAFT_742543 [Agrocybe pediades]|nr:hypothetical protein CPC08DRAFT_742543 [Agrocybe pediades]